MSIVFKFKTDFVTQSLGNISYGFLCLSHGRYKSRFRYSELYLCGYKILSQKYLDLFLKLLQKTNQNKNIFLLNSEPRNRNEE